MEEDLIKLEDLNAETSLPKNLIDLLNKQSFNGTLNEEEITTTTNTSSCNTSLNSNKENESTEKNNNSSSASSVVSSQEDEAYDQFDTSKLVKSSNSSTIKRTHLINLIYELYDLRIEETQTQSVDEKRVSSKIPSILVESFMEKLPPGKNLKNSILLAWKRRYFRLNSIGILYIYDIDDKTGLPKDSPDEVYNLMGGKVEFEQNKIISLDDNRGNYLVFRCSSSDLDLKQSAELYSKWRNEIDSQTEDRSSSLWVRPNQALTLNQNLALKRNVLIVDIGTCSIRAGLFDNEPQLPKLFVPNVCSRDLLQNKLKVGFDAFDFLLGSSAPSTIDLRKSISSWSLCSSNQTSSQLIFPFKNKTGIDKLNVELDSIEAILTHVVDTLNIQCAHTECLIITSHKLTDKLNVQYLNLLLLNEKFKFKSASILNQTLMALYSYNANVGVIANLGEKIEIVPICGGIPFQSGVTSLAYGGSCMSEFLNYYISRGHVSYVNDMEQFYVRYVKEKSCYTALNFQEELNKFPNDSKKFSLELKGRSNEVKNIEFPESARFKAVEGLFNPEIWGLDGQGLHKLIHKAIQSSSMDLRREMASNIYLCGGMSQIPGLKERLEKELRQLLPPTLRIKVNCSEFSYHAAYLGAFRFIQQPEYERLQIKREEWINESVNCLRKWRTI